MPWWGWLIATVAPSLLGSLFGGSKAGQSSQQQNTTTSTTTPATGYSSPLVPMMDLGLGQALTGRYNSLSGAGMPGGNAPAGTSSMLAAIMQMLQGEMPGLMDAYRKPQAGIVPATNTRNIWSA